MQHIDQHSLVMGATPWWSPAAENLRQSVRNVPSDSLPEPKRLRGENPLRARHISALLLVRLRKNIPYKICKNLNREVDAMCFKLFKSSPQILAKLRPLAKFFLRHCATHTDTINIKSLNLQLTLRIMLKDHFSLGWLRSGWHSRCWPHPLSTFPRKMGRLPLRCISPIPACGCLPGRPDRLVVDAPLVEMSAGGVTPSSYRGIMRGITEGSALWPLRC